MVLRAGVGDEVSDAAVGAVTDVPADQRWTEYAQILTRLWESFPRDALVGDQERAVVIDASRVHRIDHVGPSYRVAGPLDGPSSVQGRPVLVAADVDVLGWAAVAASADVVVVETTQGADEALTAALAAVGRRRDEVALVGRVAVDAVNGVPARQADELRARVAADRLDGIELAPLGGARGALAAVRRLVPLLAEPEPPTTLRAALAPARAGRGARMTAVADASRSPSPGSARRSRRSSRTWPRPPRERERTRDYAFADVRALAEAGIVRTGLSVEDGGAGGTLRDVVEVVIDVARADSSVAQALRSSFLTANQVAEPAGPAEP